MPCYKPIVGYRSKFISPNGKYPITFSHAEAQRDKEVSLPCGQCIGCKLDHSRVWAIRCVHESSMHLNNSFITLTYNGKNLPEGGTLVKKHYQDFMKRLRDTIYPVKVRYFHAGEYGYIYDEKDQVVKDRVTIGDRDYYRAQLGRPHYHACIFGYDFPDKTLWKQRNGIPLYRSKQLEKLWNKGYSSIGQVTFESAAYVARYCTKKLNNDLEMAKGEDGTYHYEKLDPETGEIYTVEKEYTTMSRRPGIGRDWYDKYKDTDIEGDFIVLKGRKIKVPKYYMSIMEVEDNDEFQLVKDNRLIKGMESAHDNTPERLEDKEKVKEAQLNMLKRKL